MKLNNLIFCFLPLFLHGCSDQEDLTNNNQDITTINVEIQDFNRITRTTVNTLNYSVNWDSDDLIGIYPLVEGSHQIAFEIQGGSASSHASFDGKGWGLKNNVSYAAYYPYHDSGLLDKNKIPVDYTQQEQNGNGNGNHICKYDYVASAPTSAFNNQLYFQFTHIGSLLHLQLTMPDAGEFTLLQLEANSKFTLKGELDLEKCQIKPTYEYNTQTLELNDMMLSAGDVLDAYLMIAPVDMSGEDIEISVKSKTGLVYAATVPGMKYDAGKVWTLSPQLSKVPTTHNGHEYIDLGITDENGNPVYWATTNVGVVDNNPYSYGGYYAWGETKADKEDDTSNLHNYVFNGSTSYTKISFRWETYKWSTGNNKESINKYYSGDGKTQLESSDDAATANWGEGWRMPTSAEFTSLLNNCCWYAPANSKIYIVYKAKCAADKGYVGKTPNETYYDYDAHIVLPQPGYRANVMAPDSSGREGYYLCSDLNSDWEINYLYIINYLPVYVKMESTPYRCTGYSIRPVYNPSK